MDSMYESIAPLIIRYDPNSTRWAFIKIQNDIPGAIEQIEKVTKGMNPAFPFRYNFMDEEYAQQYQSEMRISTISMIFAFVSIFISCLGLLGLSSYTTDQRSREIGIRKVHGAATPSLIMTLSRSYAALMIIAFILAAPVSYYLLQQWLNDFVFRIDMNVGIYLSAGLIAFAIGAFTVGLKSYQAASVNPVRTLKAE